MVYPADPRPFRAGDDPRDPVVDERDADRLTGASGRARLTGSRRERVAVEDRPLTGPSASRTPSEEVRHTPTEPLRQSWDDDPWPPLGATQGVPHLSEPDMVERLERPDERARLLLGIAVMVALTLLLTLATFVALLAGGDGREPVIVDGVPCLVEDGEGDQAVLYCQR